MKAETRLAAPFLVSLIVLLAMHFAVNYGEFLHHDVGSTAYVARLLNQGRRLYQDVYDMNTPMASYILVPAFWLAALGPAPSDAVRAYVSLLVFGCAVMTFVISRLFLRPAASLGFGLGVAVIMLWFPAELFATREHMVVMLTIPYFALAAARWQDRSASWGMAVAAGLAGGIGFSIKPHYFFSWLAVEAAIALHRRQARTAFRVEGIVLGSTVLLLAAATLVFFPDYLREMVPAVSAFYGTFNEPEVTAVYGACLLLGVAAGAILHRAGAGRPDGSGGIGPVFLLASFGAVVGFVTQGKGWVYHALPALSYLAVALVPRLSAARSWLRAPSAAIALGGIILLLGDSLYNTARGDTQGQHRIARVVSEAEGAFMVYSVDVWPGTAVAIHTGKVYGSRLASLLFIPSLLALEQAEGGPTAEVRGLEDTYRRVIAEDLVACQTALVLVRVQGDQMVPPGFNMLAWLLRDRRFAQEWTKYRAAGRVGDYRVYRRMITEPSGRCPA